jgi:predicted GIY-YIG superfamily endonuclease
MSVQDAIEIDGDPTAVYRLFSADGTLLYVGVTRDIAVRFSSHEQDKRWWPQVARKTMTWYGSRDEALTAEDAAIAAESPAYNIAGVPRERDDPQRRTPQGRALESIPVKYPFGRIARDLEKRIRSGEFTFGVTAPSEEELQSEYGVSAAAVRKALTILRDRGTIMTRPEPVRPQKKRSAVPARKQNRAMGAEPPQKPPMVQAAAMFKDVTRGLPSTPNRHARHPAAGAWEGVSLSFPRHPAA